MLHDEGGDPKVVGRYDGTLLPQLQIELGVVMGGLVVRHQQGDPGTAKKPLEVARIRRRLAARGKSRPKLPQNEERKVEMSGCADDLDAGGGAAYKIAAGVGIEPDV